MRLLIVEDDREIAEGLTWALRRSGYAVDAVADGRTASNTLKSQAYDLVILDLGLPGMDGRSVLKELRNERKQRIPVLILTARDDLEDRVDGLDLGADDYMVKPVKTPELEARIRAVMRRASAGVPGDLHLGSLRLKSEKREVYLDDRLLDLPPREFAVLEVLLLRHDRVVNKKQIQNHLCDWSDALTDKAIEIYISRLRKKIEDSGVEIRTVRGFGYLLEARRGN